MTLTQCLTVSTSEQVTYPQPWAAYNEAQTNEKDKFLTLLSRSVQRHSAWGRESRKMAVLLCRCPT